MQTEEVVKAGLRVFQERTRVKDEEVQLYRDAVVKLAQREGMEVPRFVGGNDVFDAVKMRDWLGGVLPESLAAEEKSRAGGSKGVEEDGGPTSAELAAEENSFLSRVLTGEGSRTWKEYSVGRFEVRCFAVEWRGSALLERDKFLRGLFRAIGREGEMSFVVGREIRKLRADYFAVIRLEDPARWRDWRRRLMFGHGVEMEGEGEGEGLFMRVLVPARGSAEGIEAFVTDMVEKCNTYPTVERYRGSEMTRLHDKGYARPGRKRKAEER